MTYKKKICLEKSMITSTSNQQMKNLMLLMKKAKARKEQELFVVEGRKMFQEVPVKTGICVGELPRRERGSDRRLYL